MSYAFYKREFSSKAAYRNPGSHIILIVPAPVSANPISSFSSIKEQLRRSGDEKQFFDHATLLFFRGSYSTNADHMNPANSLATAVVALHGSLPRWTSLR